MSKSLQPHSVQHLLDSAEVSGPPDDDRVPFSESDFKSSERQDWTSDYGDVSFELDAADISQFQARILRAYLAGPMTGLNLFTEKRSRDIRAALTKALSPQFEVYDPAEMTPCGSSHSNELVHCVDHSNTRDADIIFYHLNGPSTGMGMETQIAAATNVPGILVVPRGEVVSRMFSGSDATILGRIVYSDVADFSRQLSELLPTIIPRLQSTSKGRREVSDRVKSAKLGRATLRLRISQGVSRSNLAVSTGISESLLYRIESDDAWCDSLSFHQVMAIVGNLNMVMAVSRHSPSFYNSDEGLALHEDRSLDNLVSFVREEANRIDPNLISVSSVSDCKISRIWSDFREISITGVAGREPLDSIIDVEGWRQLYAESLF